MQPIVFECHQFIPASAAEIAATIADTEQWKSFGGYGFLPGIASAVYEKRTDDMIGSRIRVQNTDGSSHVEEIYAWNEGEKVAMKMHEFTPPLSRMAGYFTEEWTFVPQGSGTLVTRHFELYARHWGTRPFLWLISLLFRRAIARNLAEMAVGEI
mgnify:CR=1 FL=1